MVGTAYTFSRMGMFCKPVEVEVDIKNGLPKIYFTGLLSQEVRESRERIIPAILNSNLKFPMKRVTINLAPAETIKTGTHFDLAIAVAILKSSELINDDLSNNAYFGELNLSGKVKWVRGILPMIIEALNNGFEKIYIPQDNYSQVCFLNSTKIIPISSITELMIIKEKIQHEPVETIENMNIKNETFDYKDIKGQQDMVNAFRIAAAGHHHMIIVGPPGSGKTMAASRLSNIMPGLTVKEIIEINKIYSIASSSGEKEWINTRPFRSPHNSSSTRALIGGGAKVLPGEVSLSHKGILFLDEFLEFRTDALQALRTIIEKKEVYISLRNGCAVYPADFLLTAACNPCPCGYYDTKQSLCTCSLQEIKKYRKKLKNPLIDRIDLQIKSDRVNYIDLKKARPNKSSAQLREEVFHAREIQEKRYLFENFKLNSEIPAKKISLYCITEKGCDELLEYITEENLLTARACHKILRISRTIADLNCHDKITIDDINTALRYRFLDIEC